MNILQNFTTLATTQPRRDFLEAFDYAVSDISPEKVLMRALALAGNTLTVQNKSFDLAAFKHVYIVGIGKASAGACRGLEQILGDRISAGYCIDTRLEENMQYITQTAGTHPLPSKLNFSFSYAVVSLLEKTTADDLVIAVVTGGGSALFCYPYETECVFGEILFKALTAKGAPIAEMNIVRKHLSLVKGGGLAKIVYPATLLALIFSDVPGNDLSTIASGPTVRDISTVDDAKKILERYGVEFKGEFFQTPKEDKYFTNVSNVLVSSNRDALERVREFLGKRGYTVRINRDDYQGEARAAGSALLKETKPGEVLLTGGETFVKVKGTGTGGRNQEVVLGALPSLGENETVISFATDGIDNTDAAGAVGDSETLKKMRDIKLDAASYLENNDSYDFFKQTGDLILTGRTGVNVSDLILTYKAAR